MPASRILRLARTSRWAIVASGTRNARAISGVVSPASVRSVSATCASTASAGWQHVKMSRSRSSATPLSSSVSPPGRGSGVDSMAASRTLVAPACVAAEPVERAVARRRGEPGAGSARDAVPGPPFQRPGEGILRALLGEVPVARDPDQGGDDTTPLLPERTGDRFLGLQRHGPGYMSQIGRTSTEPTAAPGIRDATSIASSRSLHSTR